MYGGTNSQYGYGNVPAVSSPQAPAQPATLIGAISTSATLIDRLVDVNRIVESLAIRIGGPFPTDPCVSQPPRPESPPAMVHLNDNLDAAHRLVSQIEASVKAMSRSLEG
jgi:hypothetical protein